VTRCRLCGGEPDAVMSARWEFLVPIEPPSQNTIASNKGAGRFRYAKVRTDFEIYFRVRIVQLKIPRATRRRRVMFTRYYTGQRARSRDHGNFIGGMKPVLDALVRQGMLVDDRPEYCEDYYRQERHDCISGIALVLEEFA